MATLLIRDLDERNVTVHLRDFLRALAPLSLEADWTIWNVKSTDLERYWFDATGPGGDALESLSETGDWISGADLQGVLEQTWQVIWGEFIAVLPVSSGEAPAEAWVTLRAIDSSYHEIETDDESVLTRIRAQFKDVREATRLPPWLPTILPPRRSRTPT